MLNRMMKFVPQMYSFLHCLPRTGSCSVKTYVTYKQDAIRQANTPPVYRVKGVVSKFISINKIMTFAMQTPLLPLQCVTGIVKLQNLPAIKKKFVKQTPLLDHCAKDVLSLIPMHIQNAEISIRIKQISYIPLLPNHRVQEALTSIHPPPPSHEEEADIRKTPKKLIPNYRVQGVATSRFPQVTDRVKKFVKHIYILLKLQCQGNFGVKIRDSHKQVDYS